MSPLIGVPIGATSTRYATTAELKTWLGIGDATDDTALGEVLDAASRQIDDDCGRFFYQTAAGVVRYYTALNAYELLIDDCVSLTAMATDGNGNRTYAETWAVTDYDLLPENAAGDGLPYDILGVSPGGIYRLPTGLRKGVRLTGTWGWASVPDKIRQACLIKAAWLFKRRDSPLGVAGTSDLGMIRVGRWDPDYDRLLEVFRRIVVT